jgi:hypothetical protein
MRCVTTRSAALVFSLALALVMVLTWGCGEPGEAPPPAPSSTTEANVSGTVKVRGKLVKNGSVEFDASNPNRHTPPRKANIDKDGHYTIKTLIGPNNVLVYSRETVGDSNLQSGVGVDVKEGDNTFDVILPPQ